MRTAIVTGANRGLGLEVTRQIALLGYRVILTSRDLTKGEQAAVELGSKFPGEIVPHQLDVRDSGSIQSLRDFVVSEYGNVDVLVNNAAVLFDQNGRILQTPLEIYRLTMETNVFGPLQMCQAFIPLMLEHAYGRIVNVSSGAGQVEDMVNDMTAYRLSKVALNGLTRMLADSVKGTNLLVNAGCPGWMRTDMGSPQAPRSAAEGAEGIVWLATLPDGGPHGGFFRDKKPISW
jgi:NAD(P)-dependent dehydrogenase (short-subunit alcohol dehydrogenase family)